MMSNDEHPFDDEIIERDKVTDTCPSIKSKDAEHNETEEISPLENYYVSSGRKKISKDLEKIESAEARKLTLIRKMLIEAQTSYTVDHVKQLIKLGRYYSKELVDFEISKEQENLHLKNICDLGKRKFGFESSKIEELVNTIKYIHELEVRLENKGLIQKESAKEKFIKRVARKEGDS